MDKSILKKIAYEMNRKLKGNTKAFIFMICNEYLKIHKILDRENWLRDFLKFDGEIPKELFPKQEDYQKKLENIECIGWLYQYFIAREKERVFRNLMKNIKVTKEDIPYATQLFTPDWIVKYLMDNSLKKIIQEKELQEIKVIDPCQGTGLILSYAFDALYEAYRKQGFSKEETIKNILTKNLYGIDIDEMVCLITKLVLILKSECFEESIIREMNIVCVKNDEVLDVFKNAEDYGSLIKVPEVKIPKTQKSYQQYHILRQKYDVVCTNPPYMGKKNINEKLSQFLKREYPDTKSELYAAFIERCMEFSAPKGYIAMITIHSWMFISSFTNLRKKILDTCTIMSMLHTGAATFDDLSSFNALATAFVLKKEKLNIETCFIRLADYYKLQDKLDNLENPKNYYYGNQNQFLEIPNYPFIYWISKNIRNCFCKNPKLGEFYQAKQGLATGSNKEFVKFWYEVSFEQIGQKCKSVKDFWNERKSICSL